MNISNLRILKDSVICTVDSAGSKVVYNIPKSRINISLWHDSMQSLTLFIDSNFIPNQSFEIMGVNEENSVRIEQCLFCDDIVDFSGDGDSDDSEDSDDSDDDSDDDLDEDSDEDEDETSDEDSTGFGGNPLL